MKLIYWIVGAMTYFANTSDVIREELSDIQG